jgi:glyoxylase I family protein
LPAVTYLSANRQEKRQKTFEGCDGGPAVCENGPGGESAMNYQVIHHVALTVTDLEESRRFYREVMGLTEIPRPPFDFPGAWFALGDQGQQLHLIVHTDPTFRAGKGLAPRDVHFAVRVPSFREAVKYFEDRGYRENADDELALMIVRPHATAGFPQLYILDPDRHIVEVNAAVLD